MKAQAASVGIPYVDLLSPNPWTGTGNAGATTGSGNCDVFVSSDGTHPTAAGHDFIARLFYARYVALLPSRVL
jgi:lysophospholipase L1-like esterase